MVGSPKSYRNNAQGLETAGAQLTGEQSLPAQLAEWHALWRDGQQQYLDVPPSAARNQLQHTECYHVSIKGLTHSSQARSQLQRACSVNHHPQGTMLDDGFLNLGFDIFWHSQIADPKVSMLIQITLASRDESGALVDEYCVAWSRVPLSKDLVDAHRIVDGPHGGLFEAAVHKGTCYYLLLAESAYGDTAQVLPPPLLIEECKLIHSVQRCPQFNAAVPFVKQDQLVTHNSFIPGLVRIGPNAHCVSAFANESCGRSLKQPVQHPTRSIEIPNMVISLDVTLFKALLGSCTRTDLHDFFGRLETAVSAVRDSTTDWESKDVLQQHQHRDAAGVYVTGYPDGTPDTNSTPAARSGALLYKTHQRRQPGSPVDQCDTRGTSALALPRARTATISPTLTGVSQGSKQTTSARKAEPTDSAAMHGSDPNHGDHQSSVVRGRSSSPWRKGWLATQKSDSSELAAPPSTAGELPDIDTLVRSLRHHDAAAPLQDRQHVFARVAGQWRSGVVLHSEAGSDLTQALRVEVGGCVQQMHRRDVCITEPGTSADNRQSVAMTVPGVANVGEVIASLRADNGLAGLENDHLVFAKVQEKWEPGLIIMSPDSSQEQTYSVLIGKAVLELPRCHLCKRLDSSTVASTPAAPCAQEAADPRLLQRSLKQRDISRPVLQDEPVFVKLRRGWRPGAVVRSSGDPQAHSLYSVHLLGEGGGVLDVLRDQICHQAQAEAVGKKKRGGLFSRIMYPRHRGASTTEGQVPTKVEQPPMEGAALQGLTASLDGDMSSSTPMVTPESPFTPFQPDSGLDSGAVCEGLGTCGQYGVESSAGSSWSSPSLCEHMLGQSPATVLSKQPVSSTHSPRPPRQHMCQVSASLKDLLRARQEQDMPVAGSHAVGESYERHEPDNSSSHQNEGLPRLSTQAPCDDRTDMTRLHALLADVKAGDGSIAQKSRIAVCVSVHNGIQTVGKEVWCPRTIVWAPAGSDSVTVLCPEPISINWVPEDLCCNILFELRLLGSPIARVTVEPHVTQLLQQSECIGWAIVPPFTNIDSTGATLNTSLQEFPMHHGSGLDPRGVCMSGSQAVITRECVHHDMLNSDTGALLEAICHGIDMAPLIQLTAAMHEGSDPPQLPDTPVQLAPQLDPMNGAGEDAQAHEAEPEVRLVTAQAQTITEVVRSEPEQPVLLQQMLVMARQQEALQQQSRHVQQLLQQMRDEQSMLASRLEDIGKGKWDCSRGESGVAAPGCSEPVGQGTVIQAPHPGLHHPDEDAMSMYTRVAQQDLRALQLLQHNGDHVSDDVFRGTPERHCSTNDTQQGITRAEAALLHQSGGGPSLLPSVAMPAAVALDIEEADSKTVNSIIIQFLSLTPASCLNAPRKMQKCFLRFQFYDFRPTETPVYKLEPVQRSPVATARSYNPTCLLQPARGRQHVLKFVVDGLQDSVLMQQVDGCSAPLDTASCLRAKHVSFAEHLAQRCLSVDLFDADSSLHVGNASIPLRGLLRQGRRHTECVLKVAVVDPFESLTVQQAGMAQRAAAFLPEQHNGPLLASRGVLQVRLINIGSSHSAEEVAVPVGRHAGCGVKARSVRSVALLESDSKLVTELIPSWHGPRDENRATGTGQQTAANTSVQASMADKHGQDVQSLQQLRQVLREVGGRKVQLEALVKQPGRPSAQPLPSKAHDVDVQERLVADATAIRERHKRALVTKELRTSRVQHHKIMAEYGRATILDFVEFFNPSGEAQTFRVMIDSPDILRPINSQAELQSLRQSAGYDAAADFHFAEHEALAGDLLHLRPQELLRMPFLLQVFKGPSAEALPIASPNSPATTALEGAQHASPDALRTVRIKLVQRVTGDEVLVHCINVVMRRPIIDRTFRFYAPKNDFLRETVKLDALPGREHTLYASGVDLRELVAVGSHSHVILTTKASSPGHGAKDRLSIKAKSHARSAQSETFSITLYATSARVKPLEFWQVHVHWLNTHEMTAVIGQSNSTSVLLKGLPGKSRNVSLFSSHPDELQLEPAQLRLPAAMQVEVRLLFHPLATGTLNMIVTVIDSDSGGLVDALLISTHARTPHVSRTFEVDLPVGTIVNKKVGYRNMYHQRKRFILGTSNPRLIKFSHRELEVPAEDQRNIGIQVNSMNESPGLKDVLIFINDEDNRNEECYKVRVHVYEPDV